MYQTYLTPENLWVVNVDERVPYQHRMMFQRNKGVWNSSKTRWEFANDPTSLLTVINSELELAAQKATVRAATPKKRKFEKFRVQLRLHRDCTTFKLRNLAALLGTTVADKKSTKCYFRTRDLECTIRYGVDCSVTFQIEMRCPRNVFDEKIRAIEEGLTNSLLHYFELFVLCNDCGAFETFKYGFKFPCSNKQYTRTPTFSKLCNVVESYASEILNSTILDDVPFNVGIVLPIENVQGDQACLNSDYLINALKIYGNFCRPDQFKTIKIYGGCGNQNNGGYGLCLVDGRYAYLSDSYSSGRVVKVGYSIFYIVETRVRDGIVVALLDRDTNASIRINPKHRFISAPNGIPIGSNKKPTCWPSIEFDETGYAIGLTTGEPTFIDSEGYYHQVFASLTSHVLPLNDERSGYTLKFEPEVAVERRYKVTFTCDDPCIAEAIEVSLDKEYFVAFSGQVRLESKNLENRSIVVHSKSETMIRSIKNWIDFFDYSGSIMAIRAVKVELAVA